MIINNIDNMDWLRKYTSQATKYTNNDINTVMKQVENCTREMAILALIKNNGDICNSIIDLIL